jgi:hypothetical protein
MPELPSSPPKPRAVSPGRQMALMLLGFVLLLPGGCSLFVIGARWREWDPSEQVFQAILAIWIVTFILAALGLALIVMARRSGRPRP